MARTDIPRGKYENTMARYQLDLTDAERVLIKPHLSGSPCKWPLRGIVDAVLYLLRMVVPVAYAAEGPASALERSAVLLRLARQWFTEDDPLHAGDGNARTGGARGSANNGRDRHRSHPTHDQTPRKVMRCSTEFKIRH